MHTIPRRRLALGAAVAALLFPSCSADSTGSAGPASVAPAGSSGVATAPATIASTPIATPTPSAASSPPSVASPELPAYHLVLLGDSVFNGVYGVSAPVIGPKLGVTVSVQSWINPDLAKYSAGGERSSDLIARLRTDETLRADLQAADAIWFDVPIGLLLDVCGPPTVPRATLKVCLPKAVAQYKKDADTIMGEIVALRPPARAAIRVLTVWQFFGSTFRDAGTTDVVVPAWQQLRAAVNHAAASHGIGVVDAYLAFSGSDGLRDAMTAGDLERDDNHLTNQGVGRLVDLLVASGLTPAGP